MSFSCKLCSNPAVGYPVLVECATYNVDTDQLLAKIVMFHSRVLCEPCFNIVSKVTGSWDKSDRIEYFNLIQDGRIRLIFETAIFGFDARTLFCILQHLINGLDGGAIRQMQQKDPRVPVLLNNLFYQYLRDEKIKETEFILNNLLDCKIIAECLEELAAYYGDKGDFSSAEKLLLRAYDYACQSTDAETQNYLLISVGNETARIALNMMPFSSVDYISRNILLINTIISRLNSCINRAVYSGKVNLYLQSYVIKLLLEGKFSKAAEIVTLIFDRDLRDIIMEKIMYLQGEAQ